MSEDIEAEIREELESLEAIYGEDLVCEKGDTAGLPSELLVKGSPIKDKLPLFEVQLPPGYPESAVATVRCGFRKTPESTEFSQRLGQKALNELAAKIAESKDDLLGRPHVFDVVMLASDWLTEWVESGKDGSSNNNEDEDEEDDDNIILPGAELKKKRRAPKWWEISDDDEDEKVANQLIREATIAAALAEDNRNKKKKMKSPSSSSSSTAAAAGGGEDAASSTGQPASSTSKKSEPDRVELRYRTCWETIFR